MFLTNAEIAELTGYKRPTKQVVMLKRQGIPFYVNAAGHPKVARAILEGGRAKAKAAHNATWEPSWAGSQAKT